MQTLLASGRNHEQWRRPIRCPPLFLRPVCALPDQKRTSSIFKLTLPSHPHPWPLSLYRSFLTSLPCLCRAPARMKWRHCPEHLNTGIPEYHIFKSGRRERERWIVLVVLIALAYLNENHLPRTHRIAEARLSTQSGVVQNARVPAGGSPRTVAVNTATRPLP